MKEINANEFEDFIKEGIVLVDFFATWCGPCKMLAPVLEEVSKEYEGTIKFGKLDVDQAADIAGKYGVMAVPTMIIFKDGKQIEAFQGFQAKPQIVEILNRFI